MEHIPVLLNEVIKLLNPREGDNAIDCTAGGGGHAIALAEKIGEKGKILAIDWDAESLKQLEAKIRSAHAEIADRFVFSHGNFADIEELVSRSGFPKADCILFDLGFSSMQIEGEGRGLSFQKDEPLDMRLDRNDSSLMTAADILARYSAEDLEKVFREYGEERYARKIARHIVDTRKMRPILTTKDLVDRIAETMPERKEKVVRPKIGKIHFATRVFQALRIEVNHELQNLEQGLDGALNVCSNGARIAAISFHSLEDRIVKNKFRDWAKEGRCGIITKKPLVPSLQERIVNPRSRSAKLRVCEVI
ncbi:MAG: 16S rRNA (cytosine(1402)-N(4))-methyltransferase RsmH [Candidatus Spechtbacteria bacterium]|nr:16S rRNA (cytosine(1402)-N(4))-methyltransferase RsmH [Candidatus Spechtbacteria bacterium]